MYGGSYSRNQSTQFIDDARAESTATKKKFSERMTQLCVHLWISEPIYWRFNVCHLLLKIIRRGKIFKVLPCTHGKISKTRELDEVKFTVCAGKYFEIFPLLIIFKSKWHTSSLQHNGSKFQKWTQNWVMRFTRHHSRIGWIGSKNMTFHTCTNSEWCYPYYRWQHHH